jgi:hypothetical protein
MIQSTVSALPSHQTLMALQVPEVLQNLLGQDALNIVKAIAILVVGWIVALVIRLVIKGVGELREVSQRDRYIPKFEIMDK